MAGQENTTITFKRHSEVVHVPFRRGARLRDLMHEVEARFGVRESNLTLKHGQESLASADNPLLTSMDLTGEVEVHGSAHEEPAGTIPAPSGWDRGSIDLFIVETLISVDLTTTQEGFMDRMHGFQRQRRRLGYDQEDEGPLPSSPVKPVKVKETAGGDDGASQEQVAVYRVDFKFKKTTHALVCQGTDTLYTLKKRLEPLTGVPRHKMKLTGLKPGKKKNTADMIQAKAPSLEAKKKTHRANVLANRHIIQRAHKALDSGALSDDVFLKFLIEKCGVQHTERLGELLPRAYRVPGALNFVDLLSACCHYEEMQQLDVEEPQAKKAKADPDACTLLDCNVKDGMKVMVLGSTSKDVIVDLCDQTRLDAAGEGLDAFPSQAFDMINLTTIILRNNCITTMPDTSLLPWVDILQELDLSHNPIPYFANVMRNLKKLSLSHCDLLTFQSVPCDLISLDLSFNRLTNLNLACPSLENLLLHENQLQSPPDVLEMSNLKFVSLRGNPRELLEAAVATPELRQFLFHELEFSGHFKVAEMFVALERVSSWNLAPPRWLASSKTARFVDMIARLSVELRLEVATYAISPYMKTLPASELLDYYDQGLRIRNAPLSIKGGPPDDRVWCTTRYVAYRAIAVHVAEHLHGNLDDLPYNSDDRSEMPAVVLMKTIYKVLRACALDIRYTEYSRDIRFDADTRTTMKTIIAACVADGVDDSLEARLKGVLSAEIKEIAKRELSEDEKTVKMLLEDENIWLTHLAPTWRASY